MTQSFQWNVIQLWVLSIWSHSWLVSVLRRYMIAYICSMSIRKYSNPTSDAICSVGKLLIGEMLQTPYGAALTSTLAVGNMYKTFHCNVLLKKWFKSFVSVVLSIYLYFDIDTSLIQLFFYYAYDCVAQWESSIPQFEGSFVLLVHHRAFIRVRWQIYYRHSIVS